MLLTISVTNLPRSGGTCFITFDGRAIDNMQQSEILVENTPPAFNTPVKESLSNIGIMLGVEKLEWCCYLMVENFEDMSTCFDRIHDCDRQTQRRTHIT